MNRLTQYQVIETLASALGASDKVWAWPSTGMDRVAARRSILVPAEAQASIDSAPLHHRAAVRDFIDNNPLALEQIISLITIAEQFASRDDLSVGEVRLSTNIDDEVKLSLYLRIRLPDQEFEIAKSDIRAEYKSEYPGDCQLVTPIILRVIE